MRHLWEEILLANGLKMPHLYQHYTLPDGRRLGYDEHGERDGYPIFYFHGTPSARVEWAFFGTEELTQTLNLRVIAVDRPGMGLSDFQPNRRVTDWPADVCALADHLHLERFGVVGYSGGVPYAAVCAARLPDRLTAVGCVAVVGLFDRAGLTAGMNPHNLRFLEANRDKPWLARLIQRMLAVGARVAPDKVIA
jgi:pimeloyl-ACP methyl ester carboxylesterase